MFLTHGNFNPKPGVQTSMRTRSLEMLQQAFGASMAGLFLILACCATLAGPSQGIWYELLRPGPDDCGDGWPIVVHLEPGRQVWINQQNTGPQEALEMVRGAMATRAERAVFLLPRSHGTVQEVAQLSDQLASTAEDLHIGLVTSRDERLVTRTRGNRSIVNIECMRWPACANGPQSDSLPILRGCR
jgi:hypothetical protein